MNLKKYIYRITWGTLISLIVFNLFIIAYKIYNNLREDYVKPEHIGFNESFDSSYVNNIKSIKDFKKYVLKKAKKEGVNKNEFKFLTLINEVLKNRFYFNGYSFYNSHENTILFLLAKYVWDDLGAIVIPDDILKKEYAACSQQAIVLMKIFSDFGYDIRKVTLNYHFVLEAKYKDKWYFFDPTFEPKFKIEERNSLNQLLKNKDILYRVYAHCANKEKVDWRFSKISYGKTNDFPAKSMILFHKFFFFYEKNILIITFAFSFAYLWLKKITKKNGIRN